jgi:hypothetical protein
MTYVSTRTSPITFIDGNTAKSIVNAVIFECVYRCGKTWATSAKTWLKEYGIELSIGALKSIARELKNGKRNAKAASAFKDSLASRSGKDLMYAEFDVISQLYHDKENSITKYVGLPANQILNAIRKYDTVVACEKNPRNDLNMLRLMESIVANFAPKSTVEIVNADFAKYLLETDRKFSMYDADLMCLASKAGFLGDLGKGIARTMEDFATICVVTCGGRHISDNIYMELMPSELICQIKNNIDVNVVYSKSGGYNDGITPMRYEILVIYKEKFDGQD